MNWGPQGPHFLGWGRGHLSQQFPAWHRGGLLALANIARWEAGPGAASGIWAAQLETAQWCHAREGRREGPGLCLQRVRWPWAH